MTNLTPKLKALLNQAVEYFDITSQCKVDLLVKGDKTVYVDPLGNKVQPLPTDVGHNLYHVHGPNGEYRQETHFQNGSPTQGVNGLSNEAAIALVLHRITKQNESFPSPYNVLAIYLLQGAMAALHSRIKDRQEFGIFDTDKPEPDAKDDVEVSRSLSIINSLGILGNILIKYDSAYALHQPGKIHQLLETLIDKTDKDSEDITIASAFSFQASSIIGSGIFRAIASIGTQFVKTQIVAQQVKENEPQVTEDNPVNNAS